MNLAVAIPEPSATTLAPDHLLSANAVAALVMIAFAADFFSFGPAWIQTRLVFMCIVTFMRQGFDDSTLDKVTVDKLAEIINNALKSPIMSGAYVASASATFVIGAAVGILSMYTVGCMLPTKWTKKLGRFVTVQFKEAPIRKLNWQLWCLAIPVGLFGDMPDGLVGGFTDLAINTYLWIVGPLPALLFGAA